TRANWPCIRFTIPHVSWMGAHVEGELYRDETTLILDFSVVSSIGSSTHRQVQIPLADVLMISLHKGTRRNIPDWLNAWVPPKPGEAPKGNNPAAPPKSPRRSARPGPATGPPGRPRSDPTARGQYCQQAPPAARREASGKSQRSHRHRSRRETALGTG